MSAPERNLSSHQNHQVRKWPCDGVARYNVGGMRDKGHSQTYSEAYETIFLMEGGRYKEGDLTGAKGRVFTRLAVRRIAKLNDLYVAAARPFILEQIRALNYQTQLAIAKAAAAQTPEPEKKEPDEPVEKMDGPTVAADPIP